jgi:hypothetical protein
VRGADLEQCQEVTAGEKGREQGGLIAWPVGIVFSLTQIRRGVGRREELRQGAKGGNKRGRVRGYTGKNGLFVRKERVGALIAVGVRGFGAHSGIEEVRRGPSGSDVIGNQPQRRLRKASLADDQSQIS